MTDTEFINSIRSVESSCDTCQHYTKPAVHPVVGFSLVEGFNETVAMDLKPFRRVHFFHIIDHIINTRYSQAAVISGKRKDTSDKFFQH